MSKVGVVGGLHGLGDVGGETAEFVQVFQCQGGEGCTAAVCAAGLGFYQFCAEAGLHFVNFLPGGAVVNAHFVGGGGDGASVVDGLQQGDAPDGEDDCVCFSFQPEVEFRLHRSYCR